MMTKEVEHWMCAGCFRWNWEKDIYCTNCGRDIEMPQWSRAPKNKKKTVN